MEPLKVWYKRWLEVHLTLHRHAGLPDQFSPEGRTDYRVWARKFRELDVTEAEATDASERLYGMGVHEAKHFFTLLELIQAARPRAVLPVSSEPPPWRRVDPDQVEREARAQAAWASLTEDAREQMRCAVRRHFPDLADRPHFVEPMAIAWHADPSSVPGSRPREEVAPAAETDRHVRTFAWSTGRIEPNVPKSAVS